MGRGKSTATGLSRTRGPATMPGAPSVEGLHHPHILSAYSLPAVLETLDRAAPKLSIDELQEMANRWDNTARELNRQMDKFGFIKRQSMFYSETRARAQSYSLLANAADDHSQDRLVEEIESDIERLKQLG